MATQRQAEQQHLEKLPPHDLDAEKQILGAILLDNDVIPDILDIMSSADFYRASHKKIFEAELAIYERGETVDLILLRDELDRMQHLSDVGGVAFIAGIMDDVPTAANVTFHAKLVREKSILRQVLNTSIELMTKCYEAADTAESLLNHAEQKFFDIAQAKEHHDVEHVDSIVKRVYARIEMLSEQDNDIIGIPSGLFDLDELLSGFQKTDLITLAARPAMGKTAMSVNTFAIHAAMKGYSVATCSMEMSKEQLVLRSQCAIGKLDLQRVRKGRLSGDEWELFDWAGQKLAKLPIYIDDTPAMTVQDIRSKMRRLKQRTGLDLLIVDYMQLMESLKRKENRTQEITEISRGLKCLAKELDIPVLSLSQLSRKCEERADKRPMLSDLRESGSIEQDSDIVMFIYRPEVYYPDDPKVANTAELIISKHRNGPIGTVNLLFQKDIVKFENLALQKDNSNPF